MKEILYSTVTIGIPVYNEEKYLAKSLESAINQTYKNIRILISDNCSTDNSFKIAKEYEARDSRIQVFKQAENIATANFEFLLEKAETEYFCFLGGHDIIRENYIEEALKIFDSNSKIVGVYPQAEYFKTDLVKILNSNSNKGGCPQVEFIKLDVFVKELICDKFNTLNLSTYNSLINIVEFTRHGNSFYGLYKREAMMDSFFKDKPNGFGDLGSALRTSLHGYIVPTPEVSSYFRLVRPLETQEQMDIRYKSYNFPDNWKLIHATYPFSLISRNKGLSFNEKVKLNIRFWRGMQKFYPLKWTKLIGFYFGKPRLKTSILLSISYLRFFFCKGIILIKRTIVRGK